MSERQIISEKNIRHQSDGDYRRKDLRFSSQTTLLFTEGRLAASHLNDQVESDGNINSSLPDLDDGASTRRKWAEYDDSDDEGQHLNETAQYQQQVESTSRFSNTKKMLPRISDIRRVRKPFFSECQSLYDRIKMSCGSTPFSAPRRSSYSGIDGNDEEGCIKLKPSVQGTAILRKGRGERAQLIDADDFFVSPKEQPIQTALEPRKPNLTPWNKSKPLTGRPQSGQPRFIKKMSTDYGTIDMACIGSKITTELSATMENKTQKAARKFRNMRAKSASLLEKSM